MAKPPSVPRVQQRHRLQVHLTHTQHHAQQLRQEGGGGGGRGEWVGGWGV